MAWAMMQVTDLQKLGREPTMEEMENIFPAVMLGLFSGVFWMTFLTFGRHCEHLGSRLCLASFF